ncbi:MAG: hypothetical protein HYR73_09150, partial [Candidatus Eisenbacteria bacterium]|nr:hypothetical protein [Candidatus Eisenbacteria bacterium]
MTPRAPDPILHPRLRAAYDSLRRAAILRHALRAAAWSAGWIALAVLLGAAVRLNPAPAWLRLSALATLSLASLAWAVQAVRASVPSFDGFLEALEAHLPELRSLVRNALDLEAADAPHTSLELSRAVQAQA